MADEKNETQKEVQPVAPGTVVTPGGNSPEPVAEAAPDPAAPISPATDLLTTAVPETSPPGESHYQANPALDNNDPDSISWTASEFVAHDKSSEWYVLLAMGTVAAMGLMYLLTKDFISAGVVVLAAVIFGIYGAHRPRQLEYNVNQHGITIGSKNFAYNEFRSFSVTPEGAFSSIVLMPLKRFAVPINIYYAPQDEEKIIELLSLQLPYEQRRRDAVDSLMRKVRF